MRHLLQFRIRTLLIATAIVAIGLAAYVRQRRLEELARLHERQAVLVAEHRQWLYTVSFNVPAEEWDKIDERERLYKVIAAEYRQQVWQPWVRITRPVPPLPIQIENRRAAKDASR